MTNPEPWEEAAEEDADLVETLGNLQEGLPTAAMYYTSDGWHRTEFRDALLAALTTNKAARDAVEGIHGKAPTCNIADAAALVLALRSVKAALKEALKTINRKLPGVEEALCIAIAEAGLLKCETTTHTFTAKANSYLSKYPKPQEDSWDDFREWFEEHPNHEIADLMRVQVNSKELERLCQALLEAGEAIPPGVSTYVKASVGVRRKPGR